MQPAVPYAFLRDAIRARFEQLDPEALATETRYGSDRAEGDDPLMLSLRVGGRGLRVSVFSTDMGGKLATHWPAITFSRVGERQRRDNTHPGDVLRENFGTAFQHDARTLVERSGPDLQTSLDGPEPIDITYEFRVWALLEEQADALLSLVKKLWPQTGAVTYAQRDGSVVDCDVLRASGPTFVGGRDPTLETGDPEERFWSWSMTYVFEAYEDNTLEAELGPTIRKRSIGLGVQDDATGDGIVVELDRHGSPE